MKKVKILPALLLIIVMMLTCTSCIFIDSTDWTYSDFTREEATDDLLRQMGVPASTAVYAPYVYSCTVQRTNLLGNADSNSASGSCKFIPYVELKKTDTDSGIEFTALVKIAELTVIEGNAVYGECPTNAGM